ncbi:MAG: hypothetical protein KAS32_18425 [Candidatus Peribacteraceae bacterium]|nr:hypothetical protein [Candidatus Peribacteraceae bacterium]
MAYCTNTDVYRVTKLSNSEVTTADVDKFIEEADEFIDSTTHKSFNTPAAKVEYFTGRKNEYIATTFTNITSVDIAYKDWNRGGILMAQEPYHKDTLVLSYYPVTSLDRVYLLNRGSVDLSAAFSDDGGSFTDNTDEANSVGGTAFNAFAGTPAVNDALYIGYSGQFEGVRLILATDGVDAGSLAVTWEYYDGSSWTTLSVTDGTSALTTGGDTTFEAPTNWEKTTVNSEELYYIRCRLSAGSYSTAPTVNQIYMLDAIESELNMRDIQFESWGEITFIAKTIPDGTRNVKVRYKYGSATVPKKVRELSASLAGCACFFAMIGGSFDDVTSYTIPEMSVSKGEPYTNMRAAIIELQKKIWGGEPGERGKYQIGLMQEVGREIKFEVS